MSLASHTENGPTLQGASGLSTRSTKYLSLPNATYIAGCSHPIHFNTSIFFAIVFPPLFTLLFFLLIVNIPVIVFFVYVLGTISIHLLVEFCIGYIWSFSQVDLF